MDGWMESGGGQPAANCWGGRFVKSIDQLELCDGADLEVLHHDVLEGVALGHQAPDEGHVPRLAERRPTVRCRGRGRRGRCWCWWFCHFGPCLPVCCLLVGVRIGIEMLRCNGQTQSNGQVSDERLHQRYRGYATLDSWPACPLGDSESEYCRHGQPGIDAGGNCTLKRGPNRSSLGSIWGAPPFVSDVSGVLT